MKLVIAIVIAALALLFIVALAGDRFPEGRRQLEAVKVMRGIHTSEGEYKLRHGHYASLDTRGPRGTASVTEGVASNRGTGQLSVEPHKRRLRKLLQCDVTVTNNCGHYTWKLLA